MVIHLPFQLSQKIEKSVTILIDINTGEILNNVLARDFSYLALKPSEKTSPINSDDYSKLLKTARQGAEAAIKEQLDVFKKEIESPLRDKITAIIGKYEEDYIEGYTKTTMDQLEQLQSEALKLCEREIRGYTINSSFHLKNVIILDTSYDIRELVFKLDSMDKEVTLLSDIFLSRIDIKCNQCGMEIDSGLLCNNGHVLCKNCSELCSVCGSVICDICDHESFVCSTCGETVCPQCSSRCTSCGATVCSDHQYHCSTCGEECCIDCYEICSICESDVCSHHSSHCTQCGEPACHEHISDCAVCQKQFCMDHIGSCAICSKLLCESHSFNSAYSSRIVCEDHMTRCAVCDDVFADDEVENCKECMDELCPSHVKRCSICNNIFCSKHINHCRDCGREICSCTHFSTCKLCGEEFCSDCLSGNGYCSACRGLSSIDKNDEIIKYVASHLPAIDRFRKFYLGISKELKTLYAKGLFQNYLVVLNSKYEVLSSKEIGFMDDLKRKLIRK